MTKEKALAKFLKCKVSDLTEEKYNNYGLSVFSFSDKEYAIGTDEEANEAVKQNIKDSAWAFTSSFLSYFCELPEEVFTALQYKCEGSNDAVLNLIERSKGGFDEFVEQAVSSDGRGHFLSCYDGEENEEGEYFIYRIN